MSLIEHFEVIYFGKSSLSRDATSGVLQKLRERELGRQMQSFHFGDLRTEAYGGGAGLESQ